uniref:Uncharacterized protein n=1 Tax=Anopheles farauti TaxID=69004 RepID=A0A182Q6W9_9DIPT
MDGGFGGSSGLFGGIDYSNGSSDYGLLNSLQSFANRGRDGLGGAAIGTEQMLDPTYERFIGDVWVGIVLTLMILSSIFCMCSCFLYHKFRQWQRNDVDVVLGLGNFGDVLSVFRWNQELTSWRQWAYRFDQLNTPEEQDKGAKRIRKQHTKNSPSQMDLVLRAPAGLLGTKIVYRITD